MCCQQVNGKRGRRWEKQQHGPGSSSLFLWPELKSWAVVVVDTGAFCAVAERFLAVSIRDFRLPISVLDGVGGIGVRRTDPVVVKMYIP